MELPAFLLEREEELYNRRMAKIEKKRAHALTCMQTLLNYHPEIPLTPPCVKEEVVGWRIRGTCYRDENDGVISVSGNRFAVTEERDDGWTLHLYIYDRDYKFKGCEHEYTKKLCAAQKESYEDVPAYAETKLLHNEGITRFRHRHHVSLVTKGGFLNVIDVDLKTKERRRYIFCFDKISTADVEQDLYLESSPSISALAEVEDELYYFHESEDGITVYQCSSGKKMLTLATAKDLVKVISRKGYVVVVCRNTITVVWRQVLSKDYTPLSWE